MPLRGLSFRSFCQPQTKSPWTRDFRHLEPIPRHWYGRLRERGQDVPPKDRIKFWNIVPGDKIRIRGDQASKIHEVFEINKLKNLVFLKKDSKEGVSVHLFAWDSSQSLSTRNKLGILRPTMRGASYSWGMLLFRLRESQKHHPKSRTFVLVIFETQLN